MQGCATACEAPLQVCARVPCKGVRSPSASQRKALVHGCAKPRCEGVRAAAEPRARPRARRVRGCAGRRLTQLAVDTGAGPRGNQTVLFLGAEDGRVLKVLAATWHPGATQHPGGTPTPSDSREPSDHGDAGSETLLLEEISLYDPGR